MQEERYDLAFIEFTERGNLFSRDRAEQVLAFINTQIERHSDEGTLVVAYVHGWKHNARNGDSDVTNFAKRLDEWARISQRRVIGLYFGWRGLSMNLPVLKNLTYWDRKAVAHQVGKGGMTEMLLRVERLVSRGPVGSSADLRHDNSVLVTIGHSFGGAVVLAALNEVLIERIVSADPADDCDEQAGDPPVPCIVTRPFGQALVLINPAIEANEILQVKELANAYRFSRRQDILMHVISNAGDAATHRAFPAGEFFGTNLSWRQAKLERELHVMSSFGPPRRKTISLSESELDTTTVGNYRPYWTGQFTKEGERWNYRRLSQNTNPQYSKRGRITPIEPHFYASRNEPVQFIYTDNNFVEGHSGIFTRTVMAYLGAVVVESMVNTTESTTREVAPGNCNFGGEFNFGLCFNYHLGALEPIPEAGWFGTTRKRAEHADDEESMSTLQSPRAVPDPAGQ